GRPVPAAPELPGRQPAIGAFAKLAGRSVPRTDRKRPARTVAHLHPRWQASGRRTPTAPGAATGRRLTRGGGWHGRRIHQDDLLADISTRNLSMLTPQHAIALILLPALGTNVTRRNLNPSDRKSTRLNSSHVKISYAVF